MALGSLVVDVSANVARFQSDMGKIAQVAENNARQIDKAFSIVNTSLKSIGAGLVVGLTLDKIKGKIDDAISSAAGLQQLSERTGATVEGLSAIAAVAKLSGTETDLLAVGLQKLSKSMVDAQNGGAKSVEAFRAIGISISELEGLRPDEAFVKISRRLAEYADGAGKTALAQQLLGKSGANLLPVARDLAEVGDLQVKVTKEQARIADEYEKNLVRLGAAQSALFKIVALEMVPVFNSFTLALLESASANNGLKKTAQDLAKDGSIRAFAEDGALFLGMLVDIAQAVAKSVAAIAGSFKVVYADTKFALQVLNATPAQLSQLIINDSGPLKKALDDRNATLKSAGKAYDDAFNFEPFSEKLKRQIASQKALALGRDPTELARRGRGGPGEQIKFNANAEAKAPKAPSAFSTFLDDLDRMIEKTGQGEYAMLRLKAAQLAAKEPASDLGAAYERIAKIQAGDSLKALTEYVQKLDEEANAFTFQASLIDKSASEQERLTYAAHKRLMAEEAINAAMKSGRPLNEETVKQLRQQTEDTIRYTEAVRKKRDETLKSASFGATKALREYAENAQNAAKNAESFISGSLSRLEDAIVEFAKTGKLSFTDLFAFMAEEFLRQQIRMQIAGATKGFNLAGIFGGTGKASTGSELSAAAGLADGTFANGINYVPYDGYRAVLHEGERVMSKQEAAGGSGGAVFDFSGQTIYVGQGVSRGEVAAAVAEANNKLKADIRRSTRNGTFA